MARDFATMAPEEIIVALLKNGVGSLDGGQVRCTITAEEYLALRERFGPPIEYRRIDGELWFFRVGETLRSTPHPARPGEVFVKFLESGEARFVDPADVQVRECGGE